MRGNLVADVLIALLAEIDAIHLVDDDRDLADAEQMQQIAVPAGLVAHAFGGVDDQHRGIGLRGAGDHVAQEFRVARRIDQHDLARIGAEADLRGVDGDALVALGLQRVEQERPFERHAAPRADRLQHLQLAVGQAAGLVQQPPDQRRFAVIDMADDDDAHLRPGRRRHRRRGAKIVDACGVGNLDIHQHELDLQIAGDAQALERILGFMIEGAAGAFRHLGVARARSGFRRSTTRRDATGKVMSASPSER